MEVNTGQEERGQPGLGVWSYRLLVLALLVANGWAQYTLWFGNQGLVAWWRTESQAVAVRKEIRAAESRIQSLKDEIRLLVKEPLVLEEVARRELGLVYPDEILLVLPVR
ncbi:MAG: septum formation initiator family protein [Magnetococcales bacterium]|nr:septum formation initiator family protein [Magnetococcales bacterium]